MAKPESVPLTHCVVHLTDRRVAWDDGREAFLSAREAELVGYLVRQGGRTVDRATLYRDVWHYADGAVSRALDVAVRRLRRKIEVDPAQPRHLVTDRGEGYRLVGASSPADAGPSTVVAVEVARFDRLRRRDPALMARGLRCIEQALGRAVGAGRTLATGHHPALDFDTPRDAIRCALQLQLDLLEADWPGALLAWPEVQPEGTPPTWRGLRAKVGIASGSGALATARRLAGAAWGGQILVHPDVAKEVPALDDLDAVAGRLSGEDVGLHEPVVQVAPMSLAARRFPSRAGSRIPDRHDAFVGRGAELAEILGHIGVPRDLCLVGPGGVGKTRLAEEVVRRLAPRRVWFCELADARDLNDVVATLGQVLGVPSASEASVGLALAGRVGDLVVLDNVEHLVDELAPCLERWRAAGGPGWLCTSRVQVPLRGVVSVEIPPLPMDEALALLRVRAPAPTAREELEPLVALLDRMPLAIELAAARLGVFAVPELRRRLEAEVTARFALLRRQDGPPRQASLGAVLESSWQLLSTDERRVLAACAVFRGGFALDVAEYVVGVERVAEHLESLRNHSLVRAQWSALGWRFSLLDTVRAFALERLGARDRRPVEVRHAQAFAKLAGPEAIARRRGPEGIAYARRLQEERANVVAACEVALDRADPVLLDAVLVLVEVVQATGPVELALDVLDRALSLPAVPESLRARLLAERGRLGARQDPVHADAVFVEAQALADRVGDASLQAAVALHRGRFEIAQGRREAAEQAFRRGLERATVAADPHAQATAYGCLGNIYAATFRPEEARTAYDRALAGILALGDARQEATLNVNLGVFASDRGYLDEAAEHYETAIAVLREAGDARGVTMCAGNLGATLVELGRLDEAAVALDEAEQRRRRFGLDPGVVYRHRGALWAVRGRPSEAERWFAQALEVHGDAELDVATTLARRGMARLNHDLDAALGDLDASIEISVRYDERRTRAYAILHRGRVLARTGESGLAGSELEEAEREFRVNSDAYGLAWVSLVGAELGRPVHGLWDQVRALGLTRASILGQAVEAVLGVEPL